MGCATKSSNEWVQFWDMTGDYEIEGTIFVDVLPTMLDGKTRSTGH